MGVQAQVLREINARKAFLQGHDNEVGVVGGVLDWGVWLG